MQHRKHPLAPVMKRLVREGWKQVTNSHIKMTSPEGFVWVVSMSCSDYHGEKNALNDLKKIQQRRAEKCTSKPM